MISWRSLSGTAKTFVRMLDLPLLYFCIIITCLDLFNHSCWLDPSYEHYLNPRTCCFLVFQLHLLSLDLQGSHRNADVYFRNDHYSLAWYFPLWMQATVSAQPGLNKWHFHGVWRFGRAASYEVKLHTFPRHRASRRLLKLGEITHMPWFALGSGHAWDLLFFFPTSTFHSFTFELVW